MRRPTTGVDAFARMGQAGSKRALTVRERSTSPRKMARELSFKDILFLVCAFIWMISLELLGVFG